MGPWLKGRAGAGDAARKKKRKVVTGPGRGVRAGGLMGAEAEGPWGRKTGEGGLCL